jgi:hypothetical protein
VFDGLKGAPRGQLVGSEPGGVRTYKGVACDKTDECGEDSPIDAFCALNDRWYFVCGRDGKGDVSLGVAVVVPTGAPGVDGPIFRRLSLVAYSVGFSVVRREWCGAIVLW